MRPGKAFLDLKFSQGQKPATVERLDCRDQVLVDAENECHGTATDTWDHIGRAHAETFQYQAGFFFQGRLTGDRADSARERSQPAPPRFPDLSRDEYHDQD